MNPTVYHGSDMRMIALQPEARKEYKDACLLAASHLWQYFKETFECFIAGDWSKMKGLQSLLPNAKFPNLYRNLLDKLSCYHNMLNGSEQYQYDEGITYVCSDIDMAKRYAYRSFAEGEMGLIVYRMVEACNALGIDYESDADTQIKDTLSRVWKFASEKEQPVVIPITNYDREKLFMEDGKPIADFMFRRFEEGMSQFGFRYCGELKYDLDKAIKLDNSK